MSKKKSRKTRARLWWRKLPKPGKCNRRRRRTVHGRVR